MVAPYTKERPVPFFGACAKNYFLFASPSSTNSFSSLLSFSVAKEGCVEVGLRRVPPETAAGKRKEPPVHFLVPSCFIAVVAAAPSFTAKGLARPSAALMLWASRTPPLCVSFQTSGGDRFLVLLLLACQQGLMAPFTPFLH